MEGSTLEDLSEALKEALHRRGVLGKIRASLRSEVFECLDLATDDTIATKPKNVQTAKQPNPPLENILINELIGEYLAFNGYAHTASVLSAEAGLTEDRLGRDFIMLELGVHDGDKKGSLESQHDHSRLQLPLLYGIVEALKTQKKTRECDAIDRKSRSSVGTELMGARSKHEYSTGNKDATGRNMQ